MDADYQNGLRAVRGAIDHALAHGEKGDLDAPIRRFPFPTAGGKGADPQKSGVKVHHGGQGEVYEIKAGTKLADALPGSKGGDVSLDRWLAATMLGDQCEDKAALDFARDSKSLSGGAAGVLLPDAFQSQWIDNLRSFMVLEAAGMTTATMTGRTATTSRIISDPPVGWRAEGANLNAGDPTFELRQLVANSLAVRVQATASDGQGSGQRNRSRWPNRHRGGQPTARHCQCGRN
jgi:hypothetical protein